ncbi:uncharacterized protein LOC143079020 [Mytilus galloprovincialis]|uniref:uncharacterized protein LOC143079020 n=1 Tax=Mytilus galloprovincialis TaxID=29158 RepID=UPI003F7B3A3F
MEFNLIYCHLYLLMILSSCYGEPTLKTPLDKFAVLGRKYSIGCEFDNTSTSLVLIKDGNVLVEVERRTCSDTHSVKNYLIQCNDSGDLTVTIQAKDVAHNMHNTTWQCSDNISQSQPFLLRVYTPPTSGPITEIKGDHGPFKFGDVVTHICTVIGGFPRPRLSWHSLNHFSSIEEYYDNKTRKNILEIQINISKSYHDYEIKCVADHEAWSIPMDKLSTPILIQILPSEPYNVSIRDITSYGFTATFSPGYSGGYIQTFYISHWPSNDTKRTRTVKSKKEPFKVDNMFSSTDYQFILYAETDIGRSLNSQKDPLTIRTTIGEARDGSHMRIYIVYVVAPVCLLLILTAFITAIVFCYKQKFLTPEVPPYIPPRATLNTDRAVYTDRAVFRRSQGLPDSETVDRMTSRCKRIRRAIKVPPILAVFRKSRYLPDCNVISDVHEAISRSTSNIPNGNGQTNSRASNEQQNVRQSAATFPRELNYPHIEIRHQGPRTSPALRRQRTNYSQIYFNDRVSAVPESNDVEEDGQSGNYGQIFFQAATLPPRAEQ